MAKLILGKPPKTISKALSFPMLDGTTGEIKVDFKYRTRSEFSGFVDGLLDAFKAETEAELQAIKDKQEAAKESGELLDLDFGIRESVGNAKKSRHQVEYVMGCVEGWNLDIKFDREAVEQMADEVPQAVTAIMQAYREAMTEGRLGN